MTRTTTTKKNGHPAADALDWDEAKKLINRLQKDNRYRDSMLIACGCYLGLRISDLRLLKWKTVIDEESTVIEEIKTDKKRALRINDSLREIAQKCYDELCIEDKDSYIFASGQYDGTRPFTRQRADQILKECKKNYKIRSAKIFSTHSLRKTFGRRVWMQECEKGRGEQALVLLCDVFGHSSVQITKRYLGIRQEEILSVYDALDD